MTYGLWLIYCTEEPTFDWFHLVQQIWPGSIDNSSWYRVDAVIQALIGRIGDAVSIQQWNVTFP